MNILTIIGHRFRLSGVNILTSIGHRFRLSEVNILTITGQLFRMSEVIILTIIGHHFRAYIVFGATKGIPGDPPPLLLQVRGHFLGPCLVYFRQSIAQV